MTNDIEFAVNKPEEYFEEHPIPIITSFYNLIYKQNRNCMILIVGDVGTGKSYIGCKICNEFDPNGFTHETLKDRCVNNPKQFLELITEKSKLLKFGSAIMFDEAGTGIPAREWYSFNNKAISYILQTFRHKRLLVVWTVPSMDLIDKQARKFFNYLIKATGVDIINRINNCQIYELTTQKIGKDIGKIYYKYPRVLIDGHRVAIDGFSFKPAPAKLLHVYEKRANEFKTQLAVSLKRESEKIQKVHERGRINVEAIAEEILQNKKRYFKPVANRMIADKTQIEIDYSVGGGYSVRIKSLAERLAKERNLFNIERQD